MPGFFSATSFDFSISCKFSIPFKLTARSIDFLEGRLFLKREILHNRDNCPIVGSKALLVLIARDLLYFKTSKSSSDNFILRPVNEDSDKSEISLSAM